jgi:hypothetical protein
MDLNSIKSQLDATESQLSQYGANLPSEIETQVQSAYTPLLERSLGVTKDLMSDYLGRAMETTSMGPGMQGTSAYDLSPSQRMGVIGRELGTMGGQLNSAISYSDYLGGQMNDLYQKAVGAAQLGQQNLADQYARQMQEYQMAWQEAENAKARAAAWRPNPNDYLTTDETKTPSQTDLLKSIQQVANSIASQRGKTGGSYSYNGQSMGDINQVYKTLLESARTNYNLNLNPQWLWQQLGNTPAKPMSYNALL